MLIPGSEVLQRGPLPFCKAYLHLFVSRVEVDDSEVRIMGSHEALRRSLEATDALEPTAVPSLAQSWRPQGEALTFAPAIQ